MTTTAQAIATVINDGYWTLCTRLQAVEAFLSDLNGEQTIIISDETVSYTDDEIALGIVLFLAG